MPDRPPPGLLERRFLPVAGLGRPELRAADSDTGPIGYRGRALSYASRTAIGDPLRWGFFEEIEPGAAADAVAQDDVRFLVNHDPNLLLARSNAGTGTMRLASDAAGVSVDADMAPTSYARDLALCLERGDIDGMSFAFVVHEARWEIVEVDVEVNGRTQKVSCDLRRLVKIGLRDVAVVTYPAYADTEAGLRSLGTAEALADHRQLDAAARAALRAGQAPTLPVAQRSGLTTLRRRLL